MNKDKPSCRVLIVEDEADLREAMVTYLEMEGCLADGVADLKSAQRWVERHPFDILVLDLGLPDGDGLEWLAQGRDLRDKGVIICSARGSTEQRVAGLRTGADGYLVKPVSLEELASLTHNLARRLHKPVERAPRWVLSPLNWRLISPQGLAIDLTHSEQELLCALAKTPGQVVGRAEIVRALKQNPLDYDLRRLEVLVRRLRSKVKDQTGGMLPISTVHAQGYAFTALIEVDEAEAGSPWPRGAGQSVHQKAG